MADMLPPVIVRIIGTDRDLLAKLAEVTAALRSLQGTELKIGADDAPFMAAMAAMRADAAQGVEVPVRPDLRAVGAGIGAGFLTSLIAESGGLFGGTGGGGIGLAKLLGFGAGGLLPVASFGSIGALAGFGTEGLLGTSLGITGSLVGAGIGAGLLGLGAGGVGAVGMGTDMAGLGQALSDVQKYRTALNALRTAVATYGKNSSAAAAAQAHLNYVLGGMPTAAQGAIVALSQVITQFIAMFDKFTGPAEALGAKIIGSLVGTAEKFLPVIGQFATENMKIIQKALVPFEQWLATGKAFGGMGIFKSLEQVFTSNLHSFALSIFGSENLVTEYLDRLILFGGLDG